MLTYTRINDKLKLQYNGIDLKCKFVDNAFKSDWMINIAHEINTLVNFEICEITKNNVLSTEDKQTIKNMMGI